MASNRDALWANGHDESVEVNQRALIDKVLARYSGEFTVFRELLQNSDDANANAVEIRFETKGHLEAKARNEAIQAGDSIDSKETIDAKASLVHQWTFKNNGKPFQEEDWNRLKKIAEGNPDEEKIGAFGVGFYSLFSVTEEPFVTSGGQWMGFYWKDKKDQLFARRGKLPSAEPDPWTNFEMPLREPAPIPRAFDLTRFIASSITFMVYITEVNVYLDDRRISRLTKNPGSPKAVEIPRGLRHYSPKSIMQVQNMQSTPISIKAELMRWVYMGGSEKNPTRPVAKSPSPEGTGGFFSSLFSSFAGMSTPQRPITPQPAVQPPDEDPTKVIESSVLLSVFTAGVGVTLEKKLRDELHRATKKNPPTKMRVDLIYTGKDEYDASKKEDEQQPHMTGSVFQGLRADLDGVGAAKIFIGHATGQTTGLSGHMSARFIPTVERESIDLMDRTVAVWNEELLYVGGFVARAAYELEMEQVRKLWTAAAEGRSFSDQDPNDELKKWLRGRALHALKFFTFRPSTPSSLVSAKLEAAFFSCAVSHPFPMISTRGVRDATDVRIPDEVLTEFLRELPVIPEEILTGAPSMIKALRERGVIRAIEFIDVLRELRSRPLSESEMIACLKWWITVHREGKQRDIAKIRKELLNAAVLMTGEKGSQNEKVISMSSVESFLNTRAMPGAIIPTDGPLPTNLLPVGLSKQIDPKDLGSVFSWRELSLIDWVKTVVDSQKAVPDVEHDLTKSAEWAERVLQVLSRAWPHVSKEVQENAVALLGGLTCVPTSEGMKTAGESYFPNVNIFRDLPVVQLPSGSPIKGTLEKVLQAIGVRKHVDLQIIFDRMIKTGDWTIVELVKYLVAVQSTLAPLEMDRLRMTVAFPKEDRSTDEADKKIVRFKASDLYEPLDVFRQLGLPVIDWGTHPKWRGNSEEAKLLFGLGLRRYPPLSVIVELSANQDPTVRSTAFQYLMTNFSSKYSEEYKPGDFAHIAFIPAVRKGSKCLAKPSEVVAANMWAPLGFAVGDPDLQADAVNKLKLPEHPPAPALIDLLERTPPTNKHTAAEWFSVLANRITDFNPPQMKRLSQLPFVPIQDVKDANVRMLPPSQCYFNSDSNAQFHSKIFVFVDFGTRANQFLSACGTKHEPSVEEIAKILLENPRKFYELAGGRDNYLTELRNIAVNYRLISSVTITRLKRSAVLLGSKRVKRDRPADKAVNSDHDGQVDLDEDDWDFVYDLLTADQVVVADDTNAYQLFGNAIFTAPQEDLLEDLYIQLGSRRLSVLVREDYRWGSEIKPSRKAADIRSLILERLPLFLHEHTHARPRITFDWLDNEKNFIVRTFGKLTVVKSLKFGAISAVKTQDASAVAKRDGRGPIELWLAGNDQVDMYEVATSMCRLIFESSKVNDALLFMTILSTDLRALRRRGYNVDRILRRQKAEREAKQEAEKKSAISPALVPEQPPQLPQMPAPPFLGETGSSPTVETLKRLSGPQFKLRQSLDSWKRRLNGTIDSGVNSVDESESSATVMESTPAPEVPRLEGPSIEARSKATSPRPAEPSGDRGPQLGITPRHNIAANIELAINACKQEQSQRLNGKDNIQHVKETEEGYCDHTGHAIDLLFIGEMGSMKIYVSQDVPDAKNIIKAKAESIARFIYVIRPICEIYKLPKSSMHIFFDLSGPAIAFNRDASLFLNLRYFEAWHDAAVREGNMRDAYISWYFTLAHEIAHNLVGPHNSEHEFYMSAISELHLPALVNLLVAPQ